MGFASAGPVTPRTNLADYPVTSAMKQGASPSPLVSLEFCGPIIWHGRATLIGIAGSSPAMTG
jgi:hypothetical protein